MTCRMPAVMGLHEVKRSRVLPRKTNRAALHRLLQSRASHADLECEYFKCTDDITHP